MLTSPGRGHSPQAGQHLAGLGVAGAASIPPWDAVRSLPASLPGMPPSLPGMRDSISHLRGLGRGTQARGPGCSCAGRGADASRGSCCLVGDPIPHPNRRAGEGLARCCAHAGCVLLHGGAELGHVAVTSPLSLGSQELPALPALRICHVPTVNSHDRNIAGDFLDAFHFPNANERAGWQGQQWLQRREGTFLLS